MEYILFSQYSFGRFAPALMALLIAVYIFSTDYKSARGRYLGLYFAVASLFHLGYFTAYTLFTPAGFTGWYLAALGPFALAFLIQFAYRFPENIFEKESKTVFYITIILSSAAYIDYLYKSLKYPIGMTETGYGSTYASIIIPALIVVFFLWTIVLLFRQAAALEGVNLLYGLKRIPYIIFLPAGRKAAAARNFGILVFFEMLNTFSILVLMIYPVVSYGTVSISMNLFFTIIYTLYAAVYLNSGAAPAPLLHRTAGITTAAVILAASVIGNISLTGSEAAYHSKVQSELRFIKSLLHTRAFTALPDEVDYIAGPYDPGSGPGDPVPVVYTRDKKISGETEILLWDIVPVIRQRVRGLSTTRPRGEDSIRYFASIDNRNYYQYHIESKGRVYGVGYNYLAFRKYIHGIAFKMILTISIAAAGLLGAFVLLFHFGISKPIRKLLDEVQEALTDDAESEGRLYEDEISYLARSVSTLSSSVEDRKRLFLENMKLKNQITSEKIKQDTLADSSVKKIETAILYLNENYRYDISREGLAAHVNMSPDRFGKGFKHYTGKKISEYINELRIKEALSLLENKKDNVLDIALEVGFESLRTFNRAFIKIMGMTPSEYRQSRSKGSEPTA